MATENTNPGITYPTPTRPFKFCLGEKVQHAKSGGTYIVVELPDGAVLESTWEPAYGYVHVTQPDAAKIFRSQKEMEDGRFVSLDSEPFKQLLSMECGRCK